MYEYYFVLEFFFCIEHFYSFDYPNITDILLERRRDAVQYGARGTNTVS